MKRESVMNENPRAVGSYIFIHIDRDNCNGIELSATGLRLRADCDHGVLETPQLHG
jgi:hypothetical protein